MATVYQSIAKSALMNWNGLTEEEANNKIETETVEELESQVYAMGSINNAITGTSRVLNLSSEEENQLHNASINGPENDSIFQIVGEKAANLSEEQILDILSIIHNGWVKDNSSEKTYQKKVDRGQLRQYAPLELIGWNEVESDLLFLEPVLQAIGITINRETLQETYHQRVSDYLEQKGIYTFEDLVNLISKGRDYYPELPIELDERLLLSTDIVAAQIIQNWESKDVESLQLFTDRDRTNNK